MVEEATVGRLGSTILAQLENPRDGFLDMVHTLRIRAEADLVMLIVKGPLTQLIQGRELPICGFARQMLPAVL